MAHHLWPLGCASRVDGKASCPYSHAPLATDVLVRFREWVVAQDENRQHRTAFLARETLDAVFDPSWLSIMSTSSSAFSAASLLLSDNLMTTTCPSALVSLLPRTLSASAFDQPWLVETNADLRQ
jgi:hypothetical protein